MNQNQTDFPEEGMQADPWNNAIPSNTIDSRSFTNVTDDWKYETNTPVQTELSEYHPSAYPQSSRNPFLFIFRLFLSVVSFILVDRANFRKFVRFFY